MNTNERCAAYLETGAGEAADDTGRLDLVRAVLAGNATWAEAPPGLFEQVATEVGTTGGAVHRGRRRLGLAPAVGIAAALLVVIVGLLLSSDRPDDDPPLVIAMSGTELAPEAEGRALLRETPAGWYVRLELSGLPPAPEDAYYQGWLWRDSEGVSIGTFHMRGGSDPVALWSGVSPADYPAIRVTLQREGEGSAPSDLVLVRGSLDN